jgi:hypothetical protein
MNLYVVSLTSYIRYMIYMFAYDAVLGILASLHLVVVRLFSFNHATDGRFIAAHPPPLFPSSLGLPFPSLLPPRSLSHGFSPTRPRLYLCLDFFQDPLHFGAESIDVRHLAVQLPSH